MIGRRRARQNTVSASDVSASREKTLPMMRLARASSPAPRAMENSGVPPMENSAVNAAISVTTGNVRPTPVSAALPSPGRWPM